MLSSVVKSIGLKVPIQCVCHTHTHTHTPHARTLTHSFSYLFDMAQGLDDSESLKFFLKTSSVNQKILISKAPNHVLGSHEI